jgi:oligosaccharide repeat unit polymerase
MSRPNCDKSVLLGALGITAAAAAALLWQAAYPSPAAVLLLGLLALSCSNYLIGGRDVLYPAFTFTAVWAVVTTAYLFCPIEIRPLGWRTIAILLGGTTFFSIGSLIGNRPFFLKGHRDRKPEKDVYRDSPQARLVLLGYTVVTVPFVVLDAQRISGGDFFSSPAALINLRLTMIYMNMSGERVHSGRFVETASLIGALTFLVFILEERRRWANALCALCMIVLGLVSTGRAFLMQALCWWLCVVLLRKRDRTFLRLAIPLGAAAVSIVILMTAVTFLNKSETQGADGLQASTRMTSIYIAGPIAALDYAVYNPGEFKGQPEAVFWGVRTLLSKLGIVRASPLPRFDNGVFVPFGMNVYTCFKPYYEEFGVVGCFLAFSVIGLIEGQLFYLATNGNHIARFLFAYLSFALMFSTFDDFYAQYGNLTAYLYVSAFVFAYFVFLKRLKLRIWWNRIGFHWLPPRPSITTEG